MYLYQIVFQITFIRRIVLIRIPLFQVSFTIFFYIKINIFLQGASKSDLPHIYLSTFFPDISILITHFKKLKSKVLLWNLIYDILVLVSDTCLLKGVQMDTKFSVALHILTMISESKKTLSSQALAISVGTNASYIRKVIALLKNADLIHSQQGKTGYQLSKSPKKMTLLEIYYATQEINHISLFPVHQNSNPDCPVGKHIQGAVSPLFASAESQLEKELANQTLEDVIDNLYKQAKQVRN